MRKTIVLLLLGAILLSLGACGSSLKEPVSFYYLRNPNTIVYGSADGLVAPEQREAAGHVGDLEYLLTLYLGGPLDDRLVSPIPEGVTLENLVIRQKNLILVLSSQFAELTDVELTAACVCIATTCFSLTDVDEVTILSPETHLSEGVSMTLTRDSVTFLDDSIPSGNAEQSLS